eukprot:PhM_4_TR1249/c0_g1_i1/m.28385
MSATAFPQATSSRNSLQSRTPPSPAALLGRTLAHSQQVPLPTTSSSSSSSHRRSGAGGQAGQSTSSSSTTSPQSANNNLSATPPPLPGFRTSSFTNAIQQTQSSSDEGSSGTLAGRSMNLYVDTNRRSLSLRFSRLNITTSFTNSIETPNNNKARQFSPLHHNPFMVSGSPLYHDNNKAPMNQTNTNNNPSAVNKARNPHHRHKHKFHPFWLYFYNDTLESELCQMRFPKPYVRGAAALIFMCLMSVLVLYQYVIDNEHGQGMSSKTALSLLSCIILTLFVGVPCMLWFPSAENRERAFLVFLILNLATCNTATSTIEIASSQHYTISIKLVFLSVLVSQTRFFYTLPVVSLSSIVPYLVAWAWIDAERFSEHGHGYTDFLWVCGMLVPFPLAYVIERRLRLAFVDRSRAMISLRRIEARTNAVREVLLMLFPPTPCRDLLIGGEKRLVDGKPKFSVVRGSNYPTNRTYEGTALVIIKTNDFTGWMMRSNPRSLADTLSSLVLRLDLLADSYGVERTARAADSIVAAVFPTSVALPAGHDSASRRSVQAIRFACHAIEDARTILPEGVELQIGVHLATVIAGFVGLQPPTFSLMGRGMNDARDMFIEHAAPGYVLVSNVALEYALSLGHPLPGVVDLPGNHILLTGWDDWDDGPKPGHDCSDEPFAVVDVARCGGGSGGVELTAHNAVEICDRILELAESEQHKRKSRQEGSATLHEAMTTLMNIDNGADTAPECSLTKMKFWPSIHFVDPLVERRFQVHMRNDDMFVYLFASFVAILVGALILHTAMGCISFFMDRTTIAGTTTCLAIFLVHLRWNVLPSLKTFYFCVVFFLFPAVLSSFISVRCGSTGGHADLDVSVQDLTVGNLHDLYAVVQFIPAQFFIFIPFRARVLVLLLSATIVPVTALLREKVMSDDENDDILQYRFASIVAPLLILFLVFALEVPLRRVFATNEKVRHMLRDSGSFAQESRRALGFMVPSFVTEDVLMEDALGLVNHRDLTDSNAGSSIGESTTLLHARRVWDYNMVVVVVIEFDFDESTDISLTHNTDITPYMDDLSEEGENRNGNDATNTTSCPGGPHNGVYSEGSSSAADPTQKSFDMLCSVVAEIERVAGANNLVKVKSMQSTLILANGVQNVNGEAESDVKQQHQQVQPDVDFQASVNSSLSEHITMINAMAMDHGHSSMSMSSHTTSDTDGEMHERSPHPPLMPGSPMSPGQASMASAGSQLNFKPSSGPPRRRKDVTHDVVSTCNTIATILKTVVPKYRGLKYKIGINCGPAVGIVFGGDAGLSFDLIGETVETAWHLAYVDREDPTDDSSTVLVSSHVAELLDEHEGAASLHLTERQYQRRAKLTTQPRLSLHTVEDGTTSSTSSKTATSASTPHHHLAPHVSSPFRRSAAPRFGIDDSINAFAMEVLEGVTRHTSFSTLAPLSPLGGIDDVVNFEKSTHNSNPSSQLKPSRDEIDEPATNPQSVLPPLVLLNHEDANLTTMASSATLHPINSGGSSGSSSNNNAFGESGHIVVSDDEDGDDEQSHST